MVETDSVSLFFFSPAPLLIYFCSSPPCLSVFPPFVLSPAFFLWFVSLSSLFRLLLSLSLLLVHSLLPVLLFLRLVVFPMLLPLWKQRNGNVMEDWWASCFLPPLLVVSLVFPPQFFFSVFLSLFLFRFLPVFLFLPQSCSPASLPLPSFYKARDRLAL